MHVSYEVPRVTTGPLSPAEADADLLIVPVAHDRPECAAEIEPGIGAALSEAMARGEFKAKPCQTWSWSVAGAPWRTARIVFVGGGARADIGVERVRRMAASAVEEARRQRRRRVAWVDVEPGALDGAARIEAVAEGLMRANFDNGAHKTRHDDRFFITEATILTGVPDASAAAGYGLEVGESIAAARALVNEPGNYLTPTALAERAGQMASVPGVAIDVLDERRIQDLGMGLLLGVARGSAEPPRVLVLRYEPAGLPPGPVLGLVGKGITFDTGGISIKAADGMERMKDDMAGGASVAAAVRSIALRGWPLRVVAVVPATENMPGGRATKPGDILRAASGRTVEVNNTDAEGRLIVGDGLWYAQRLGATHLIDVATLTGSVVVALGKITTGLYGTPQWWVDRVRDAAGRAGEKVWQMPLFEEYGDALKSEIADTINSPGRQAGSITAAMFLKAFAGDAAWAHLDIAGTAWAEEARPWQPKGATGATIRTLIEVARAGLDERARGPLR